MQRRDFLGWLGLAAVARKLPAMPTDDLTLIGWQDFGAGGEYMPLGLVDVTTSASLHGLTRSVNHEWNLPMTLNDPTPEYSWLTT